jgi:hypothetical protein
LASISSPYLELFQHYLAIRGDLDVDSQGNVNPHISAYFSYISLVMGQSLSADIPMRARGSARFAHRSGWESRSVSSCAR